MARRPCLARSGRDDEAKGERVRVARLGGAVAGKSRVGWCELDQRGCAE